jgi:beta-glucuronidase
MGKQINLAGWWKVKFDPKNTGMESGWADNPPSNCADINLPSSWNEVFPDHFHYDGTAWFFRDLYIPAEDLGERISMYFEGVNYLCEAFVNGQSMGTHEGGFTPFAFPIGQGLIPNAVNHFAIRVDSKLSETTLPPRGVDWFNYGGINRPFYIQSTAAEFIRDHTLKTRMDGTVSLSVVLENSSRTDQPGHLEVKIFDATEQLIVREKVQANLAAGEVKPVDLTLLVPLAHLWNLRDPYLYSLQIEFTSPQGVVWDQVSQRFGIREYKVDGHKLLLNGKEVKLVGCAKHEDYPGTGRTVSREQLIKDYDLLRQMNVNFVRLSHYPHNRLEHEVLDELGMVAISEIPMVFLREAQMTSPAILEKSKKMLAEMIRAEKNTTSIMFWSLFIECETDLASTRYFVQTMVDATRTLDDTRLIVMASNRPLTDISYDLFDVVGVNYWSGWYEGESIPDGINFLATMAKKYPDKPLLITSHGWEGWFGERSAQEKTPWSEDLQADYLTKIADVYMSFKNIVGEIVWTFSDFRVSNWNDVSIQEQNLAYLGRPLLVNHKGMVDYHRRPKTAYFSMREKFAEWQQLVRPFEQSVGQNLSVKVFTNRRLLGEAAAFQFIDHANELLRERDHIQVLFASAGSQVEFLDTLMRNRMFVDWSRINAYHLDEFVGADQDTPYGFARWIRNHLIDQLPFRKFEALDGKASNLLDECKRYGDLLMAETMDIACVGIGENGHLAFNDPPVADFNDRAVVKVIDMDDACREQQFRDGVFADIGSVPQKAYTTTIPAILRSNTILCVVPGTHKAVAVWKTLRNEISTACPASILRRHTDATLFLDSESAALAYPAKPIE